MRLLAAVSVPLSLLLFAPRSHAADASPSPKLDHFEPTVVQRQHWYGWETLLADGLSLTVGVALAPDGVALGLGGYLLAPPLIHLFHVGPMRSLGSFGLRVGLPLAGGFIGAAVADCSGDSEGFDFCPLGEIAAGVLIGMAGAITLDAVFAYEKEERFTEVAGGWRPRVSVGEGSVKLEMGRAF